MTDMIERVAIALSDADEPGIWNERPEQGGGTVVLWEAKEYFRAAARAAIQAMREPSDEQVEALARFQYEERFIDQSWEEDASRFEKSIWRDSSRKAIYAMIDAALQEKPDDR